MKPEKIFVIMEVEKTLLDARTAGVEGYLPMGAESFDEIMWLRSSHIIPKSRLRYGLPVKGDVAFFPALGRWEVAKFEQVSSEMLILDPEPTEPTEKGWCLG